MGRTAYSKTPHSAFKDFYLLATFFPHKLCSPRVAALTWAGSTTTRETCFPSSEGGFASKALQQICLPWNAVPHRFPHTYCQPLFDWRGITRIENPWTQMAYILKAWGVLLVLLSSLIKGWKWLSKKKKCTESTSCFLKGCNLVLLV